MSVFVHGLRLHAHHGVGEDERRIGQRFVLDLVLDLDIADASRSDRLSDTASYDTIVQVTTTAFTRERYRLVEAAAGAVADALLGAFPRLRGVVVTVRKPLAPVAAIFDEVGVTLTRRRNG